MAEAAVLAPERLSDCLFGCLCLNDEPTAASHSFLLFFLLSTLTSSLPAVSERAKQKERLLLTIACDYHTSSASLPPLLSDAAVTAAATCADDQRQISFSLFAPPPASSLWIPTRTLSQPSLCVGAAGGD